MLGSFEAQLESVVKYLEDLKKVFDLDTLSVQTQFQFSKLSVSSHPPPPPKTSFEDLDDLQERILKDMEKSYAISFEQLTAVAKKKINYLSFLKL